MLRLRLSFEVGVLRLGFGGCGFEVEVSRLRF